MLRTTPNDDTVRCIALCGPANCGKITLAKAIERQTGCNRIEGDDFHSEKWKRKPYPLSDAEREQWMRKLIPAIRWSIYAHQWTVATCSALTPPVQSQLLAIDDLLLVYLDISLETARSYSRG